MFWRYSCVSVTEWWESQLVWQVDLTRTRGRRSVAIVETWRMRMIPHSRRPVAVTSCCPRRHLSMLGPWFVPRLCRHGSTRPCCGGSTHASTTHPTWRPGYSRGAHQAVTSSSGTMPQPAWSFRDLTAYWRSSKAAFSKILSFDSRRRMPHDCMLSLIQLGIISRVRRSAVIYSTNNKAHRETHSCNMKDHCEK